MHHARGAQFVKERGCINHAANCIRHLALEMPPRTAAPFLNVRLFSSIINFKSLIEAADGVTIWTLY